MNLKWKISYQSPISLNKFKELIINFENAGETIDDRGRNKTKLFKVNQTIVVSKLFQKPNFINKFVYKYIRKSKAHRSYEYANILLKKGINTPEPLAYFECTSLFRFQKSYYFSKFLKYDFSFHKLVNESNFPDHENILRQFTQFTYKLHENGIYFKDHSPGNTLIVKNGKLYHFYLIDLNRMDFITYNFNFRMKNFSKLKLNKEMIEIISDEYAKLINKPYKKVYQKIWEETEKYKLRQFKKERLKEKYLGR